MCPASHAPFHALSLSCPNLHTRFKMHRPIVDAMHPHRPLPGCPTRTQCMPLSCPKAHLRCQNAFKHNAAQYNSLFLTARSNVHTTLSYRSGGAPSQLSYRSGAPLQLSYRSGALLQLPLPLRRPAATLQLPLKRPAATRLPLPLRRPAAACS